MNESPPPPQRTQLEELAVEVHELLESAGALNDDALMRRWRECSGVNMLAGPEQQCRKNLEQLRADLRARLAAPADQGEA